MNASSVDLGFTPDAFKPFYNLLNTHAYTPKNSNMPDRFLDLMGITPGPDKKSWIQVCNLTTGPTYRANEFYAKYSTVGKPFDPNFFSQRLGMLLFSVFVKILIIIGIGVAILLFVFFFDVTLTFIALMPVIFALICTLGTLKLIGHSLDIPGMMLAIIVFGMGIDYSLFFTRSYQRYGDAAHPYFGLIRLTIFMASTSTIIGFGVLCSAEHSLLRSAGITSVTAIGYSLMGAFIILPPVLDYRFRPIRTDHHASGSLKDRVLRRYKNLEAYPRLFARFKLSLDPMFPELPGILKNCQDIYTIADIGCGYGVPACWLLECFPEATVYGIDPDDRRTRVASMAIGKRGVIANGSAPDFPAVSEAVDLAIMLDILHFLKDEVLKVTLRDIHGKLRGGGCFIIRVSVPPKRHFPWVWWMENLKLRLKKTPCYYRSVEKIKTFLVHAGFTIERIEPSGSKGELVWFVGKTEPKLNAEDVASHRHIFSKKGR